MESPIKNLTAIRYYLDGRHWDTEEVRHPSWTDVDRAIRRMDNYCFPIVQLNTTDNVEDENIFNVCGGDGRWSLFHTMGNWQYEDAGGSEEEVRLWDSDQGYYCCQKNLLTDVAKVLRITKAFFETGSYELLDSVR
jgi:hypothetical protein